jgi:hypothetical protein
MNPETILQLIPAVGWRVRINSRSDVFKDIVCFALTSDHNVVPLIVGDKGDSIAELKSSDADGFSIISPADWEQLDRASALQNREYGRLR